MTKVIVVGGGAAGMMAAGSAASLGANVTLLEKKRILGSKLLISGKGRCNVTNDGDIEDFIGNFHENGRFLYSAFRRFFNDDLRRFLASYGVETKVERGNRVFPVSDNAGEVVSALTRYIKEFGVRIEYNHSVTGLLTEKSSMTGVVDRDGREWRAGAVILATGGASYPGTGSTGDGQRLAAEVGHKVTPLYPALVPLRCAEEWVRGVQGLTLRNVAVFLYHGQKLVGKEFGELLFTHFGVSGPVVLTLSRWVSRALAEKKNAGGFYLSINLKPALSFEQLNARVQRDFDKYSRKQFKNSLEDLLPRTLIPVIVTRSGISPEKPVHQITRRERENLVRLLQDLRLTVTATLPLAAAIVTAGGVSVDEIDPRTMESKLIRGLYFAGEIMDLDANTGGYNLQAAFSTGYLAGTAAAQAQD